MEEWRKLMESKKFNWNKLLNGLIAGIAIILASIFIGICFIIPTTTSVKASLTKEQINNLNIHFVSAKTKIRQATGYNKVRLLGNSNSSDDSNQKYFYSYNYNYKTNNSDNSGFETTLYSKTDEASNILDNYSSNNGNVYLSTENGGKVSIYEDIATKYTDGSFIDTNAHSFQNTLSTAGGIPASDIQEIFYDEIDNGDFVLLDNYTPYSQNTSFNVENFYLSIGTPYHSGQTNSTPLYDLRVSGMLYNKTGSHILSLNEVNSYLFNEQGENKQYSRYWYQYFDLKSLKAHKTTESNSATYDIEDLQGKYVITFYLTTYITNEKGELIPDTKSGSSEKNQQEFEYTFYLLDSANYDVTPSINNSTLGYMKKDELREYFFNYTTENPYLSYNPQKFNLSYTKENREVNENISSSYTVGSYQIGGNVYPLGIISYVDGSTFKKQVFILTYYNKDRTLVEYLYLSSNSTTAVTLGAEYSSIETLVKNGTLKFEYKKSLYLTVDETNATQTTYETKTYVTKDYEQFGLLFGNKDTELTASQIQAKLTQMDENPTFERIVVTSSGEYKYSSSSVAEYSVAKMTNHTLTVSEADDITKLKDTGIIFKKSDFGTTDTLDDSSTKYQLVEDNGTYKLRKSYIQGESTVDTDIALPNISSDGTYELVDPIDRIISIVYTCVNGEVTKLEFIQNIYSTTNINANSNILNKVLYPNQIQIETTYNLEFDTLGVYTFDYKYNCANFSQNNTVVTTNNLANSSNILDIQDVGKKNTTIKSETIESTDTDKSEKIEISSDTLYINVWGYLDENNSVTLAGTDYVYNTKDQSLKIGDSATYTKISELQGVSAKFGNTSPTAYYTVSTDAKGQYILNIKYQIATVKSIPTLYKTTYSLNESEYIVDRILKTKTTYEDSITYANANDNSEEWGKIVSLLDYLEKHNNLVTASYIKTQPNLNGDILHVFGSETYFNKTDSLSDTGYSKLKLIDSKTKNNYISDVTKYYTNNMPDSKDTNNAKAKPFQGFVNEVIGKNNGFTTKNLIVTDITPVFFKNLSSLLYSGKVSQSYIYRYPNYQIKADGTIDYGDCVTDIYTKDTYCQFDGLYEIVILYKYDAYESLSADKNYGNTVFYQLITFAIDNSSPKLDIKVQDVNDTDNDNNTEEYIDDLGLKKYTNRNVQLSWNIPTYFQNEVYLDIERQTFDGSNDNNFKVTYIQNALNTQLSQGNLTYAQAITSASKDDNKYYVTITSSNQNNSNGNYKVTLHYSSRGASTVSEKFVVDKENISGLKTLPVIQVTGGYAVDEYGYDTSLAETKQIINKNFTFRYNAKSSGAKIYTYWYKIDLNLTNNDAVLKFNNETAITTNYEVFGRNIADISSANQYIYNYPKDDMVQGANYFASDSSAIYLFNMIDEAGNECRYVVFYDKTTPNFVIEPTPNNSYNVVNNTSKVVLGDYKAIKIDTADTFGLNEQTDKVDNYSKNKGLNKLQEAIGYIHFNSNFNDTQVKLIDGNYYLLLPINSLKVEDINSNTTQTYENKTEIPDEFYFFPSNPVETDAEGTIIKLLKNTTTNKYDIAKISDAKYTKIKNTYNQEVNKYITATSASDANIKYYGAIGKMESGEYNYTISDRLGNKITGYIWVNTDMTQTWGYGIFDTKTSEDNLSNAVMLGASGSYSASKLYISSKKPSVSVPDYTLTYKYFGFNADQYTTLFKNYTLSNVKYWNEQNKADLTDSKITITGKQTYIELIFTSKTNPSEQISHFVEITNKFGKASPQHSYPYDIDGIYPIVNPQGEPEHIYTNDTGSYTNSDDIDRLYSRIINPNADETGKVNGSVTQEGLYIFKREYNEILDQDKLGEDEQIVYLIYYVDRTGVINVTTSQDFGYILGSNYTNSSLKKYINQDTIKNAQVVADTTSTASNNHYKSEDLFSTNKIKVQFNLTYDKYNFDKFVNDFENSTNTSIDASLQEYLDVYLLNKSYFSRNLYKLNLTIAKGLTSSEVNILEENSDGTLNINNSAYTKYLGTGSNLGRLNSYNFFLEDKFSSPYKIYLKDNSGYRLSLNGNKSIIPNYQSNELDMSFSIKHTAPEGDGYGKYYGRHNYDVPYKDYEDANGNTEIRYNLLGKYLAEGQLDHFDVKSYGIASNNDGQVVKLYSTNNETLIFTFQITNDDTKAQIDPNNIQIYQGATGVDSNLIFNRVNGRCDDKNGTLKVNSARMQSSFIANKIDGVTYYAIIIFDNNLDELTSTTGTDFLKYRLLDRSQNLDSQNYYVVINYVGDKSNYVKEDNAGKDTYYNKSTYEITVDRNKPIYNLTKLMSQDKYVFNNKKNTVTKSNYESLFDNYKSFYNFYTDTEYDFERSDLEKYFFALDYREDSSFVFERVNELDSNDGIFIRRLTNNNGGSYTYPTDYKFSKTPDDYKTYYNTTYLQGHKQFSADNSETITRYSSEITNTEKYYYIKFDEFNPGTYEIKVSDLYNNGILVADNYYEIIERDEAGNYRVYAVYLPNYQATQVKYEYKVNNSAPYTPETLRYNTNTVVSISGIDFNLREITTHDFYLRANLKISSTNLNETVFVTYNPVNKCIYVRNSDNTIKDTITNVSHANDDFTSKFLSTINNLIKTYNDLVSDTSSDKYTKYGHQITLEIVDRLGIKSQVSSDLLYNYEITYNVAGSVLAPIFKNNSTSFTMEIPAKTGTTNIKQVRAFVFAGGWSPKDPDDKQNSFYKTESELIKGATYTLGKGVYKFEIIDNFNRINYYFYEFGSSSIQPGGILRYSDNHVLYTDGYNYTGKSASFVYDNSVYDIFIKFVGEIIEDGVSYDYPDSDTDPKIVYSSDKIYSEEDLSKFGLSIATIDNITTITFTGISDSDLTKYHIKTIPATLSSQYNYTWGKEATDNNLMTYNYKLAIYTAVQNIVIRNSNGNALDTSGTLNLSEDFEVSLAWTNGYQPDKQINFDSKVILENLDNGQIIKNGTSYIITDAGNYRAYVINSLNTKSSTVRFTRSEGDIGIYSVFAINNDVQTKLNPSVLVSTHEYADSEEAQTRQIIEFNYFTTTDYFSFVNKITNAPISIENDLQNEGGSTFDIADVAVDKLAAKYLDVQVKSDLNIFVDLCDLALDSSSRVPYAEFRVYTKNGDEAYTYRFVKVFFLQTSGYSLATTQVTTNDDTQTNIYSSSSIIKRPDEILLVTFNFRDTDINPINGNTIYVDRYFNNKLVETQAFSDINTLSTATYTLTQVGLHKFVIRDLAGRAQSFGNNMSSSLQIYLINQILFTVNDSTPINNQIFNGLVNIKVQSTLAGITLYNTRTLGVSVVKNGQELSVTNPTEFTFSEAGSYTVKMIATTVLSDENTSVADQEISTTYKFTIIKTNVAQKSFNVSKGTGFVIDKVIKIVNNERQEVTEKYRNSVTIKLAKSDVNLLASDKTTLVRKMASTDYIYAENYNSSQTYTYVIVRDQNQNQFEGYILTSDITAYKDSLLWLSYENEGNSKFEITLKYYNSTIKDYQAFTFEVWINNDQPVIISNVANGSATKDTIALNFNPGIIYTQVGNCKIYVNNKEYLNIDENSERLVQTITITQKGKYNIKIVSEDGSLISSYQFTKNDPINNTTKIILICVACGVVVLVVLFLLVRRKGKYR